MFIAASGVVASQLSAQEGGALIVTPQTDSIEIELFTGDQTITSFDLTIPLDGVEFPSTIENCVSGLPTTHFGDCNIDEDGNFKLIAFSPTNEAIESGLIGAIRIPTGDFQSASVHAFSPDGSPASFEFLAPALSGSELNMGGERTLPERQLSPDLKIK